MSDFSSGQGQQNTLAGSNFYRSILSGDPTKTATVLAPQINSLKTSVQENQKSSDLTGNRSGGKAAGNAAASDKIHSDITNLTGTLTGQAASALLSSGQSLLGTALGGYGQQASLDKQRTDAWANSILGKGISSGIGTLESFGLEKLGGTGGGGGGASAPADASSYVPAGPSPADSDPFADNFDSTGITPYYG